MIHRVHGHAANRWLLPAPTRTAGLAIGLVLVVEITNLADRSHAIDRELANFAGRHFHERIVAFLAEKLRRSTGRANRLATAPGIELEVVHHRARRNVANLQGITRKDIRILAGRNRCADFEPHGVQDVALFTVGIVQQSDVRAAVRVVFDGFHLGGDAMLVAAEIDHAVLFLVAAATVPDDDFALIVSPTGALFRLEQALLGRVLGDLALVEHGHEAPRRRVWIKTLKSHLYLYLLNLRHVRRSVHSELSQSYKFSAYSIIFSPSASFTYAFFQSRR